MTLSCINMNSKAQIKTRKETMRTQTLSRDLANTSKVGCKGMTFI